MYSIDPYDLTMLNIVSDLRASSNGKNKVLVSWTKSAAADGYLIYAQKNKKYGYCGMTSKTSFVDKKALDNDYNFYWVYPYVMGADGNRIVGKSPAYVYAKGICASVTNSESGKSEWGCKTYMDEISRCRRLSHLWKNRKRKVWIYRYDFKDRLYRQESIKEGVELLLGISILQEC